MANQTDAKGCPFEPSERIRRVARLGLAACGGSTDVPVAPPAGPLEGPAGEPTPALEGPIASTMRMERSIVVPKAIESEKVTQASGTLDSKTPAGATLSFNEVVNLYRDSPEYIPPVYEVRWERIIAPVERFHSREDARAVMALLRTRALGAAPQANVNVPPGGIATQAFSWTQATAAQPPALAQALHATPVGGVSQVFDDEGTVQMVRVLERREVVPIAEPVVVAAVALEAASFVTPPPATIRRATHRLPDCDCVK